MLTLGAVAAIAVGTRTGAASTIAVPAGAVSATAVPVGVASATGAPAAPGSGPGDNASELGRLLFWDPILSGEKDVSCATCHHPDFA